MKDNLILNQIPEGKVRCEWSNGKTEDLTPDQLEDGSKQSVLRQKGASEKKGNSLKHRKPYPRRIPARAIISKIIKDSILGTPVKDGWIQDASDKASGRIDKLIRSNYRRRRKSS